MWVTTTGLPTAASHPFHRRPNQPLREHGFDDFAERQFLLYHDGQAQLAARHLFPTAVHRLLRRD